MQGCGGGGWRGGDVRTRAGLPRSVSVLAAGSDAEFVERERCSEESVG